MINIPDSEIEKSMKILDLTKEQAIEMWLEDEGYLDNEEQLELTQKAKENKITATIHSARDVSKPKANKPKTFFHTHHQKHIIYVMLKFKQVKFQVADATTTINCDITSLYYHQFCLNITLSHSDKTMAI